MPVSSDTIDLYLSQGKSLFPLKHLNSGKDARTPLHKHWPTRHHSPIELKRYAEKGHGIAWRPGKQDLVIDVDPRNGGKFGAARLFSKWDIPDLNELTPTVVTGRGGSHYYLKLPKPIKLRKSIDKVYKGIDFITKGAYVIIPGSPHPQGVDYQWDMFSDPYAAPLTAPDWLLEQLQYKDYDDTKGDSRTEISTAELTYLLNQLNAEDYDHNADWEPLMMACHHGTRGAGLEEFVTWSTSDPKYQDHHEVIRTRWRSLGQGRASLITVATLFKEVIKRGGRLPTYSAEDDFGDQSKPSESLAEVEEKAAEQITSEEAKAEKEEARETKENRDHELFKSLRIEIDKWGPYPTTSEKTVRDMVRRSKATDLVAQEVLRKDMIHALGKATKLVDSIIKHVNKEIDAELKALECEATNLDWADELAKFTLHYVYQDTKLVHANNQIFYQYIGTHWEIVKHNVIASELYKSGFKHQERSGVEYHISPALGKAEQVLIALTATGEDVFRFAEKPPSVVNTLNYELWIDPGTGEVVPKEHRAESYLTTCLGVKYNPNELCCLFDRTLKKIFEFAEDPDDMIRHLWEIYGYIIQPLKNIPAWFLLYGGGSNGKSVIVEVLTALVGPKAMVPRSVHDFAGGNNNHATASFPGKLLLLDDDADTSTKLPEGWLKKLAEGKILEANPKRKDTYNFRSILTPVLCANGYPILHSVDYGMMRRIFVIPFKQKFLPGQRDINRAERIINKEMSGVLNKALEGLARLRARGEFKPPKECVQAVQDWLISGNSILRFIDMCTKPGEFECSEIEEVYHEYEIWCRDFAGVKRPANRSVFENTLKQQEYEIISDDKQTVINGIRLIAREEF